MLCQACPQVPVRPRRREKARPLHAASTPPWPRPAHGLVRGEEAPAAAGTRASSRQTTTAHVLRLHPARLAVCTVALFSAHQKMGEAAAEMPPTQPCTAYASGPVCGVQRACSTTACQTLRESSGSLVHVMTPWGVTHTPFAVPAGWPSWPCRSSCPACAATYLCAPAYGVGKGVAAAGESTRRSDEARLGGGRGSLDLGDLDIKRRDHLKGCRRWKLVLSLSQTSDVALQSPRAFHCIPLFLLSTWGLPLWSTPAEGVLHSDQALWESSGAFIVDFPRLALLQFHSSR